MRSMSRISRAQYEIVVWIFRNDFDYTLRGYDQAFSCKQGKEGVELPFLRRVEFLPRKNVSEFGEELRGGDNLMMFECFGEKAPGLSVARERRDQDIGI